MSELYIPIEKPNRNLENGRFLKGNVPHNKGKKWADYMDMRKARRIKRIAVKNLVHKGQCAGWNARPVVAIDNGRLAGVFPSSEEAGRKSGITARNIRHCCDKKKSRRVPMVLGRGQRMVQSGHAMKGIKPFPSTSEW